MVAPRGRGLVGDDGAGVRAAPGEPRILFKNADNGSGRVKGNDYLSYKSQICISWRLTDEQLNAVVKELRKQVGSEFTVIKPPSIDTCIVLKRKKNIEPPMRIRK